MSDPAESHGADELDSVRQDRDQARAELAQTVSELSDKADVRARAQDKAHETAQAARERATEVGEHARAAAAQVREQAALAADTAVARTPEPVLARALQAADIGRRNPIPLTAAALSGVAVFWWISKRRRA
ncbi:DUF3618 domain-containing protein [Nocardia sp. NPDC056000]|uniref:DUF3618 domain-containing protein n=1 Tax=Nocardia sp. NPDC056000 TaxID=3345674 RepID=UPI0035D64833